MNQKSQRQDSALEQGEQTPAATELKLEKPPSIAWMLVPAAVLALLAYFSR